MKHTVIVITIAALLLLCTAAFADGRVLLDNVGEIRAVAQTHLLLVRDTKTKLWGIYDTSGKQLLECVMHEPTYISYGCFRDASYGDELNRYAVAAEGFVSKHEYGSVQVYNYWWAIGLKLTEATEENYDYKSGAQFYFIDGCDVFYLADNPHMAASLSAEAYAASAAHGDYISIMDKSGAVTVYDRDFNAVENLRPANINESVYGIQDFAVADKAAREIILDGFSDCREVNIPEGLYLQISRTDYNGIKQTGIIDLNGNWLFPMCDDVIKTVTTDYVIAARGDKQGLYSIADGRYILEPEYDSIFANRQAFDPYVNYGIACGIKDDVRYYVDVKTGETVNERSPETASVQSFGFNTIERLSRSKYQMTNAYGEQWTLNDGLLFTSRGDGSLVLAYSYADGQNGVYYYDGTLALDFKYKFRPVITDDGHVIIRKYDGNYQLLEVDPLR